MTSIILGVCLKILTFVAMCFALTLGMDSVVRGFGPVVLMDAAMTTSMATPAYASLTSLVAWVKT